MLLTILATSDVHGYVYPTDYMDTQNEQPFGLLKLVSLIDNEREKAEGPVLLIENGDFIQGSPMSQFTQENNASPEKLIDILNDINYDLGVIGNHEFNYGKKYLKAGMEAANFPILSANIFDQHDDYFADAPTKIIEKAGVKIGVLGLTTQYIPHWEHPSHIRDLQFEGAVKMAKKWVPRLREEADIVVVAYHGGFEADLVTGKPTEEQTGENESYRLLTEVAGIDALITGHQHRNLATHVNGVPIIQPGSRGESLGKIVLDIKETNEGWTVLNSQTELLSAKISLVQQSLTQKYQFLQDDVNEWLDQVIGETDGDMRLHDASEARLSEHPYIEFINRVQLHYGEGDISLTALFSNQLAGYHKEITIRDIILNYPYPNTLAVIQVSGAELKKALEQSAEYFTLGAKGNIEVNPTFTHPKPQPYNYDMYEGIDYIIDVSKPAGERITYLKFKGETVQADDQFELVANQYRAVGGGDYSMFEGKPFIREINVSMSDLITAYIKYEQIISATVNHNFKVVNGNIKNK